MIRTFFKNSIEAVGDINRKYATPHLKTTRFVRICLGLLRGYLLLLIGILAFKFFQALH